MMHMKINPHLKHNNEKLIKDAVREMELKEAWLPLK